MGQARQSQYHHEDIIKAQLEAEYDEEEYANRVMRNVYNNVSQLFFQSGLTLTQFALQVGISHSSLARILDGRKSVSLQTLCKIGAALNISIEKLFVNEVGKAKTDYDMLDGKQQQKINKIINKMLHDKINQDNVVDVNQYTIFDYIENPRAEGLENNQKHEIIYEQNVPKS